MENFEEKYIFDPFYSLKSLLFPCQIFTYLYREKELCRLTLQRHLEKQHFFFLRLLVSYYRWTSESSRPLSSVLFPRRFTLIISDIFFFQFLSLKFFVRELEQKRYIRYVNEIIYLSFHKYSTLSKLKWIEGGEKIYVRSQFYLCRSQ